jgi:ADP-heptose:LPS heptosyltransferase
MALRRNILIFHSGALGDFIVTWPIAVALARLHPQSRVFYITHGQKGALAERVLRIESLDVDSGGWHRLFSQSPDLPAPAARTLAGAHTVLSFMAEPDDRWSRNVLAANPEVNLLTIHSTAGDDFAGHQAEYLADQLHPWPAVETAARQILHSVAERGLGNGPAAGGPIVIHPGGGAAKKCWPAERYLALAGQLRRDNHPVRVLLGEVELERWPADVIANFRAAADVQTPGTLVDLMSQISSGSAFVGNDSGPGHLAGIMGMPTLSLFGEASKVERWKPLGPRVQVMEKPLGQLEPQEVAKQVVSLMAATVRPAVSDDSHEDEE